MTKICFLAVSTIFTFTITFAQSITLADYDRAAGFLYGNLSKKIFNRSVTPTWLKDSTGFTYQVQDATGTHTKKYDYKTGTIADLKEEQNQWPRRQWEEGNRTESKSPDGEWTAFVKEYNLFIKNNKTGEEKQLSYNGKKNYEYASYYGWGELIEGENGERPAHFLVSWSPDSKWIQAFICDLSIAKKMYLLDWSIDTLYKPKLLSYYRGSPGDTDMVYMTPVIFNIATGEENKLTEFKNVNQVGFRWMPQPATGIIYEQERGYQKINLYLYNAANKTKEFLYTESSPTNIDNFSYRFIEEWNQLVFTSEKDGWKQLYMLSLKDKKVTPLTNGQYYVNDISLINKNSGDIFFTAKGKEDVNPYYDFAYKVNVKTKKTILLTPEKANHDVNFSPDGKYLVDNISTMNQPTRTVLRNGATGKILKELAKAAINLPEGKNWPLPQEFTTLGRDGKTSIYAAIWKPSNFDAAKKYPVIDQSYTGPHTYMFPNSFSKAVSRGNQALAELGFIVVAIDGLGTAGRSKALHNVSYKNMGQNLLDHVIAIKAMGRQFSWIDTTKVGIFGHSAGGYDAGHAVLEFPDFYKVAVASSADHDFRMEKDWWPEMYMGWPVDSTYHQVSNITMAPNLKGKLLIVHGGIDENVNPSATFKLAEALVNADKQFDMLIFPSQHHGYTGKAADYFQKRLWNYFVEHLKGEKPIWDFKLR
ncbi:MAG: prolyl oligopeptidase family serine peptidase [Niabella sp.]